MIELLKNTSTQLSTTFSTGAADGAVTVTIVDGDGSTVVNAAAATHGTGGTYTYVLAPQDKVKDLTVTWAGSFGGIAQSLVDRGSVVGEHLFTLAELRAFGDGKLADTSKYPDSKLIDQRIRVTELFEERCGVSFIPRWGKTTLDGRGQMSIWLDHRRIHQVFSATVNGTALTVDELAGLNTSSDGRLERTRWPTWLWSSWLGTYPNNVVVTYEHGWQTPPSLVSEAGMAYAHFKLTSNILADRFMSQSNEFGIIRQSVPTMQNPTGLVAVDAVLARYDETPVFAAY